MSPTEIAEVARTLLIGGAYTVYCVTVFLIIRAVSRRVLK